MSTTSRGRRAATGDDPERPRPRASPLLAGLLHRHPRIRLIGLLSAPLGWLVVVYLGSLAVMLVAAFWSVDPATGTLVRVPTLDNLRTLLEQPVYRRVALRTLGVAVAVTLIDVAIALPVALYLAKVAAPRFRGLLLAAVLTPLWVGYLVKAHAWRAMLASDGVVNWALEPVGLRGPGFGLVATTVTLAYLWLPYMILPIYAGLVRIPSALLEASSDLGAPAGWTLRRVVLPLVYPAIVAGSIVTFSLSLGDYLTVRIVGGGTQLFASLIHDDAEVAGNLPLAAAAAFVPVLVVLAYLAYLAHLAVVRRSGVPDARRSGGLDAPPSGALDAPRSRALDAL